MKLIMTRGLPASGKTTWAREQVEAGRGKVKRVNKDDLRQMIDNRAYSPIKEKQILLARDALVKVYLGQECDVIVDDTGFNPEHESVLRKIANEYGAKFEIEDFYEPVSVCIARDTMRDKPVGQKVIRDMWLRYVCKPAPPKIVGAKQAIICDIDGTIARMTTRGPYDWSRVGEDEPVREVIDVITTYNTMDDDNMRIILFSGRMDSCENETRKWLRENGVGYDHLYMRKDGDNRKDYQIKRELYEKHIQGKYNVLFVLDDRDQVVDQWREMGLKCFQVAPGTF